MDAVGARGKRDVGPRVDEEPGGQRVVANASHGVASEEFESPGGKILFAELNVVDAGACGFGDAQQELAAARLFVAGEGVAVGDVVEQQETYFRFIDLRFQI